ncbi:MAG TPA: hypothetical protein VMH30_02850, partial [Verrucomicrobiae bacterium]|nr:hypothetical protein [Verrucomicrobiae bacterium]
IDPDEKEAALDDPAFIEAQLDVIDANHNGMLDREEIAFFDVYHHNFPSLKEQTGIEITEHLLAERLMKKFDANGDGILQPAEFQALEESLDTGGHKTWQNLYLRYKGDHPGIDIDGLTDFLKAQTAAEIGRSGIVGGMEFEMPIPIKFLDQFFIQSVDDYWPEINRADPMPAQTRQ